MKKLLGIGMVTMLALCVIGIVVILLEAFFSVIGWWTIPIIGASLIVGIIFGKEIFD